MEINKDTFIRTIGIVSVLFLALLTILIYQSYALYKTNQTHNFIEGVVGDFSPKGDLKLVLYIDGVTSNTFPTRTEGKALDKIECSNTEAGRWDYIKWELVIGNLTKPTTCNIYFKTGYSLTNKILVDNEGVDTIVAKGTPNFATTSTTNTGTNGGMFAAEDDYGISYYYRGNITNNNVLFAGFAWKIIRITGESTIKLIYNGTSATNTTGTATQIDSTFYAFNTKYNDNRYVGYMFGETCSDYITCHTNTTKSNAMTQLENWYNTNFSEASRSKIVDTIYCNDRGVSSASGYGTQVTYYLPYNRLNSYKPSLKCTQENDQFTIATSSKGNKNLTYPVGLITADEVAMAGGAYGYNTANTSYYLYTGQDYWTMSPHNFYNTGDAASFCVRSTGALYGINPYNTYGLRSVITLSANAIISGGNGTSTDPYVVN